MFLFLLLSSNCFGSATSSPFKAQLKIKFEIELFRESEIQRAVARGIHYYSLAMKYCYLCQIQCNEIKAKGEDKALSGVSLSMEK